jgi:Ca2+/H+ antiporter, TMEM165/GDT1 family
MAMGFTRNWKSAIAGTLAALVALAIFTAVAGYALANWLEPAVLKLVIGALLLIFGLQWMRKAIYRYSGRKAIHDEDKIYRDEVEAAKAAGGTGPGLDMFAFMVSFKGVFLEGLEVVFIVLTFGLSARANRTGVGGLDPLWIATFGAAAAILIVLGIGIAARKPLSMIPENTLKYVVGLLLVAFGTYWSVGGLGAFFGAPEGISWPGSDLAILYVLAAIFILSRIMIAALGKESDPNPRMQAIVSEGVNR